MDSWASNVISVSWLNAVTGTSPLPTLARRARFSAASGSVPACARTLPGPFQAPAAQCVMVSQERNRDPREASSAGGCPSMSYL